MPKRKRTPLEKKQATARTARPAGARWRKRGRWWERRRAEGSAGALAVRVAQRGHEVSEQLCSQLELGLRRARDLPQASSSTHIVSAIPAFPLCFGAG